MPTKEAVAMRLIALVAVLGPPLAGLFLSFRISPFRLAGTFAVVALLALSCIWFLEKTRPGEAMGLRSLLFRLLIGCTWAMATSFVGHVYYSDPWW